MSYHFRNLVFEGGGVKGIAYIGALQKMEQRGILTGIRRVGGTSAGAITAVLVALDYSLAEIDNILRTLNFKKFMDDSWGVVRDTDRLLNQFGWYKGDFFRDWIGEIIKAKTGNSESTFNDAFNMKEAKGFTILAMSDNCAIQAVKHSKKLYYGVQFHPEVNNTEHGEEILENFVEVAKS